VIISVIKELQYEYSNELLSFIQSGEILQRLSDYGRCSREELSFKLFLKSGAFNSHTAPNIPITVPDYFPSFQHWKKQHVSPKLKKSVISTRCRAQKISKWLQTSVLWNPWFLCWKKRFVSINSRQNTCIYTSTIKTSWFLKLHSIPVRLHIGCKLDYVRNGK
jgi:hypothetical protein